MRKIGLFILFSTMTGCASASSAPAGEMVAPLAEAASAAAASLESRTVEEPGPTVITISAIGDCAIGDLHHGAGAPGSFAAELAQVDDPMGYPFSGVRSIFEADDLTIANLEGTLTDQKGWQNPVFSIRGAPELAEVLVRGGVELVDLANNHSMDYGLAGHEDTKAALTRHGVGHFGDDLVDRRTIAGMRVVNLGYLGGPSGTRVRMVADVAREKGPETIVIVSFHWGIEGYYATAPDQQRLGRAAIDAGADLVLGHHPHVVQGIESYRDRPIVYSLGNFVFGANSRPADMDSMIFQARFVIEDGAVARVEPTIVPVRISSTPARNDFRPVVLEGAEAQRVLDKVANLSDKLSG
jgi:poly-gamma-glutamate capsule biosynthesis protein CapA/YwtB (metallophosphatase superfamily)